MSAEQEAAAGQGVDYEARYNGLVAALIDFHREEAEWHNGEVRAHENFARGDNARRELPAMLLARGKLEGAAGVLNGLAAFIVANTGVRVEDLDSMQPDGPGTVPSKDD